MAACGKTAEPEVSPAVAAEFAGSTACRSCHEAEFRDWLGSHHQMAMQVAEASTVLGDFANAEFEYFGATTRFVSREGGFYVETADENGETREYRIAYTFGVEPLQQYLIEFPGGRLQTLAFSWDTRPADVGGQRWFHIYPDENILPGDPLHWTGREQNWNYMCAECHSTNVEMNFDAGSNSFDTRYSEISVGCEACHGPGSRHIQQAANADMKSPFGLETDLDDRSGAAWIMNPDTGIAARSELPQLALAQPETCARCHSRRGIVTPEYVHGRPLADTHMPSLLDESLYLADGQIDDEVYVYGSFLQSRMYRAGVTCSDCHDPHTAKLITGANPNDVCGRCHLPGKFDVRSHHGHASDVVACVDCHMTDRTYMVVDDRRDHSFRVPRPDITGSLGIPNACNICHEDRDAGWATAAVAGWHGADAFRRAEFATALAAGRNGFANAQLAGVVREQEFPGIVRATALSLLAQPIDSEAMQVLQASLSNPDALIRIAALRVVATLPPEQRLRLDGPDRLSDPVRGVRLEAASAYAGLQDLLSARQARAYGVAAGEYRAAFEAILNRPEAHARLGDFELANGNVDAALRHFEKAIDIEPRATIARVNLADVLRAVNDEQRAEALLRDGLETDPDNAALKHSIGLLLVRTGRRDEAIVELRSARNLAPDNARYAYVLGVALNSVGMRAEALRELEAARRRFETNFDINWALATMYRDGGQLQKAAELASELSARHPDEPNVAALRNSLPAIR